MNAEAEMAGADGLGGEKSQYWADHALGMRLREMVDAGAGYPELGEAARKAVSEPATTASVGGEFTAEQIAAGFEAARTIAAHLAEPGDWNGGDVCDVAATALIKAGLLTKEQCNN